MCNKKKKTISLPSPGAKSIKVDKRDPAYSFSLFYCKLVNYSNSRIISPQNNKHHSSRFRGNFRNSVFQRNKFFSWKKNCVMASLSASTRRIFVFAPFREKQTTVLQVFFWWKKIRIEESKKSKIDEKWWCLKNYSVVGVVASDVA